MLELRLEANAPGPSDDGRVKHVAQWNAVKGQRVVLETTRMLVTCAARDEQPGISLILFYCAGESEAIAAADVAIS